MKETRGMKIVGERLSPEEARIRIRGSIFICPSSRSLCPIDYKHSFVGKEKLAALVEYEALKIETKHALNRLRGLEHPPKIESCDIRDDRTPDQKRTVKREKSAAAKCLGNSRKKCPKCEAKKRQGRVKIWPMPFGKRRLLCSVCGWTDGRIAE